MAQGIHRQSKVGRERGGDSLDRCGVRGYIVVLRIGQWGPGGRGVVGFGSKAMDAQLLVAKVKIRVDRCRDRDRHSEV